MDLHHHFSAGHPMVMHVRSEISKTARREHSHLAFVKAIATYSFESAGQNSDVFAIRMPMRCNAVTVRHLEAHGVIPAGTSWVALEYCKLRSWAHERRRWT